MTISVESSCEINYQQNFNNHIPLIRQKEFDDKILIGLHINTARKLYQNIRVVEIDEKRLILRFDYCSARINIGTKNNIIIRIDGYY